MTSSPSRHRTLFTCGRVNPIAPSIAGRRREYQRSKRARLFRREYFKQSSSNFQIYLCKECPSRPAVSRSRNSKAHRRRISAVFSALLFIRFSKVRYPHRTFRNDANFECASGFVKTSATWKSVPLFPSGYCRSCRPSAHLTDCICTFRFGMSQIYEFSTCLPEFVAAAQFLVLL